MVLIFMFVKNKNDIYIYGLVMTVGSLVSQVFLWFFLKQIITFTKVKISDIFIHVKQNVILFVPVIAISLYTTMSKILLGSLSSMEAVGLYESANRLTSIPSMVVTSLGTVMLPRMSNLISKGKDDEAAKYIHKSFIFSVFLSCSMSFGISSVCSEFVPLFYGKGFEECVRIIPFLVISSIFISWANVIRTQYLIPAKKDKVYILSVFVGAIVNLILNIILIPMYSATGSAIATFLTEFSVCGYQTFQVRKEIKVKKYLIDSFPFILIAIFMYFVLINIPYINSNLYTLIIKCIIGGIIYIFISAIYFFKVLNKKI